MWRDARGPLNGRSRRAVASPSTSKPIGSRLAHLVRPAQPDHDVAYLVERIGGSVMPSARDPDVIDAVERVGDEESFAKPCGAGG